MTQLEDVEAFQNSMLEHVSEGPSQVLLVERCHVAKCIQISSTAPFDITCRYGHDAAAFGCAWSRPGSRSIIQSFAEIIEPRTKVYSPRADFRYRFAHPDLNSVNEIDRDCVSTDLRSNDTPREQRYRSVFPGE